MKIALTYNLPPDAGDSQAEPESAPAIDAIESDLVALGHQVERLEVGGPVSHLVARLESLDPELVVNLARGKNGRFREGFFPGLFEQMGLPFTGSDAYTTTLAVDKHSTKLALLERGLPVAPWIFLERAQQTEDAGANLQFPLIVKPNFETGSRGISQESVVEDLAALERLVSRMLPKYPDGLILEEYIAGRDLSVLFLGQILEPCEYLFSEERKYSIYDEQTRRAPSDRVAVQVPAKVDADTRTHLLNFASTALSTARVRDYGRVDFRLSSTGKLYVIGINAGLDLREGTPLYPVVRYSLAPEKDLDSESLAQLALGRVLNLAASRLQERKNPTPRGKKSVLRVGVAFNLKSLDADNPMTDDSQAEFDSPLTVQALMEAVRAGGHEPIELEATPDFPQRVVASRVDLVFNIAEGVRGRNRESQVPSILELLDVPYTGSDPACLCLTLDKGLAKRIVAQAGVPTPKWVLMTSGKERLPKDFNFPMIVKPLAEGSSKGVSQSGVVESEIALRTVVTEMVRRYGQPALVEEFVGGREFTVGLLGERQPKVLPIMEVVFLNSKGANPIYGYEQKQAGNDDVRFDCPAVLEPELHKTIANSAKAAFKALGCRDVARVDFRMDSQGRVHFIECNPLPGLTPNFSDLAVIGLAAGLSYQDLIGDIMAPAIRRYRAGQGARH